MILYIRTEINYFLLVFTMILWGLSWPIAKILVTDLNPVQVGFFRFLTASIAFGITAFFIRSKIQWRKIYQEWRSFFILGLTGIFGYGILFLVGLQYTTSSQGAIIAGINPATVSLFSFIITKEKLVEKWRYIGFILSFIGVIFVIGVSALIQFNLDYLIGNIIIFIAMICWGLYSGLGKKLMEGFSSFESTSIAVLFGMLLFGMSSLFFSDVNEIPTLDNTAWLGIMFLGLFVTFIGFFAYFTAVQNIGASRSSIFINLVPIFGVLSSYLILDEEIIWTFVVGLIMIILGIFIINYKTKTEDKLNKIE